MPKQFFYYPQVDEKDTIRFENPIRKTFSFEKNELNTANVDEIIVSCKKGLLVLFPAYVLHTQGLHFSDTPRYSIAFNFFPTGVFGKSDSTVHI